MVCLVIAVFWAPQIGAKFSSLLKYYQEMLTIIAPPVVAAFILGVFWPRINSRGAFLGLLFGAALGVVNLVYKSQTGVTIFGDIHFLLTVPLYMIFSIIVMIIVSYLTAKPDYERIRPYLWSKKDFIEESRELKHTPWYSNYRTLTYILLALCLIVLVVFA